MPSYSCDKCYEVLGADHSAEKLQALDILPIFFT